MQNSKIEWTDHTFNPWIGCTKVSPGCLHCYAESLNLRWRKGVNWGKGAPRQRTTAQYWREAVKWNDEARRLGTRPRVFCASLADWLDPEVPAQWLSDLLELIEKCSQLDWLLLTKRPEMWRDRMEAVAELPTAGSIFALSWARGKQPENVWLGTSVEDQTRANLRVPALMNLPAKVRFLSCEPLLGPVDLLKATEGMGSDWFWDDYIDWVICGGESGPMHRPMAIEWASSLSVQCKQFDVPFLMKQMGGHPDKRHNLAEFPSDLQVREFPS